MNHIDKQAQGTSNREWGAFAESIAADYLIAQGYAIRERNYRMNKCEIDIIAQIENEIVFVEVKARSGRDQDPLDAVDKPKRARIVSVADAYLKSLPTLFYYRFDIITLTGDPDNYKIEHYPDAYMAPLRTKIHSRKSGIVMRPKRTGGKKKEDEE